VSIAVFHVKGNIKRVIRNEEMDLTYLNYRESKVKDYEDIWRQLSSSPFTHMVEVITPLSIASTVTAVAVGSDTLTASLGGRTQTDVKSLKVTVRLSY
jgi:hypothetical protein